MLLFDLNAVLHDSQHLPISLKSWESIYAFYNSPTRTFPFRTLLLLSIGLNQRSHPKCRNQRASWSQTQIVPALLNSTARWMKPTRSTQRLSSFFSALRTSMELFCGCYFWIAFKSGFRSSSNKKKKMVWINIHFNWTNNCTHICLRLKNSNQLETSLQNGKALLSSYENKLAREEVAPSDITSLEKTQRELAVRRLFYSLPLITTISHSDW